MKHYKVMLIAFLLGITIFSVFKYLSFFKEKYLLLNELNRMKSEVAALGNEKHNLLQTLEERKELQEQLSAQNSQLQEHLKTNQSKLDKTDAEFAQAKVLKVLIEHLNSELASLEAQNQTLKEEKDSLSVKLSQVTQEKEGLKARFGSLVELKKAIKELKMKMRQASRKVKPTPVRDRIIRGNQGFLIKNGKPTYPGRIKIEIIAVPKNE